MEYSGNCNGNDIKEFYCLWSNCWKKQQKIVIIYYFVFIFNTPETKKICNDIYCVTDGVCVCLCKKVRNGVCTISTNWSFHKRISFIFGETKQPWTTCGLMGRKNKEKKNWCVCL